MRLFNRYKSSLNPEISHTDFANMFKSMANGQQLYDKLKKLCHPDLYAGTEKEAVAEELFKLLQENRMNYNKLIDIQNRIEFELL